MTRFALIAISAVFLFVTPAMDTIAQESSANPFLSAPIVKFVGDFSSSEVSLSTTKSGGGISGTMQFGGQSFTLNGSLDGKTVAGKFSADGNLFDYQLTSSPDGGIEFSTDGYVSTLQRTEAGGAASAAVNPMSRRTARNVKTDPRVTAANEALAIVKQMPPGPRINTVISLIPAFYAQGDSEMARELAEDHARESEYVDLHEIVKFAALQTDLRNGDLDAANSKLDGLSSKTYVGIALGELAMDAALRGDRELAKSLIQRMPSPYGQVLNINNVIERLQRKDRAADVNWLADFAVSIAETPDPISRLQFTMPAVARIIALAGDVDAALAYARSIPDHIGDVPREERKARKAAAISGQVIALFAVSGVYYKDIPRTGPREIIEEAFKISKRKLKDQSLHHLVALKLLEVHGEMGDIDKGIEYMRMYASMIGEPSAGRVLAMGMARGGQFSEMRRVARIVSDDKTRGYIQSQVLLWKIANEYPNVSEMLADARLIRDDESRASALAYVAMALPDD